MKKLCPEQQALLTKIMQADFYYIEWKLFVDTHPWDQQAACQLAYYAQLTDMLKAQYAMKYGPFSCNECGPFPWQITYT